MELQCIGYNHPHGEDFVIDRPKGLGSYLLLLIKTPAIFRVENQNIKTEENSFIIYEPNFPQYYTASGKIYTDDWCHFSLDKEDKELLRALEIPLDTPVHLKDITTLSSIIRNMTYEFYSESPFRSDTAQLYMKLLLFKLAEQLLVCPSYTGAENPHFEAMQNLRNDIYSNPCKSRSIDEMAEETSMSRSCFQHTYKELFGVSPVSDIINSRLSRAKYYLLTSDMTVAQIARKCGYTNESYFMRQFKQKYDRTPSDFRGVL